MHQAQKSTTPAPPDSLRGKDRFDQRHQIAFNFKSTATIQLAKLVLRVERQTDQHGGIAQMQIC